MLGSGLEIKARCYGHADFLQSGGQLHRFRTRGLGEGYQRISYRVLI